VKTQLLPTPDELSLPQLMKRFDTEERAIAYFEAIRWPDGPVCPHCDNSKPDTHWKISGEKRGAVRAGLWQCGGCKKQFRVTVGTIFEGSHIPLNQWLIAWFIMAGAKKGVSALQMQRHLGLGSYRSAWFLCHRIRHAMQDPAFNSALGGEGKEVEVDETYVGGKPRHANGPRSVPAPKISKMAIVVSLVERGGNKRSMVLTRVGPNNLTEAVLTHVAEGTQVHTDECSGYNRLKRLYDHRKVNHSKKEYHRVDRDGTVSMTNTVESSFSLIKRGLMGAFHHVSHKHLPRYLAEFDHRWNLRKVSDGERMNARLKKTVGARLTYKPLTAKPVAD
jgi:transposase-like protein